MFVQPLCRLCLSSTGTSPVGNLLGGCYKYMSDLLALEATATGRGPRNFCPLSPLAIPAWQQALASHPDRIFTAYILTGIQAGFHIGADRASLSLRRGPDNMPSVREHPHIVEAHIAAEVGAGRLLGPLPGPLAGLCHSSPIGLIPKPHQPGKWRLIVDLSSPHGHSVNDAIEADLCHMHYSSVLEAAELVRQLGPGTLLAKVDLHQAYRILPVHADDHPLLGIQWGSDTYVDSALPFGLRSAPKIFSAFADALAWILGEQGVTRQLHYLDDFLFVGPPRETSCAVSLHKALEVCQHLGVPVATHKTEGPSTHLVFLGIRIDTERMQLSLDQDKLARIVALVESWDSRRSATKRELQSLIGHLSHAATVVQPGRTFLRRMIDLMKVAKQPGHHVRLTVAFRSDLHWWASFLPRWNGRSIIPQPQPLHTITADASGSWGCGAVNDEGSWFQLQWPESWAQSHIAAKEMVPIIIAVAIWGKMWPAGSVRIRSDNMAVVSALASGSARDALLMHLLRCLHFFSAHFDMGLQPCHIPGVLNTAADALSRDNMVYFFQCCPQAREAPSAIPDPLVDMLVHHRPDWTSTSWRRMFLTTLGRR